MACWLILPNISLIPSWVGMVRLFLADIDSFSMSFIVLCFKDFLLGVLKAVWIFSLTFKDES